VQNLNFSFSFHTAVAPSNFATRRRRPYRIWNERSNEAMNSFLPALDRKIAVRLLNMSYFKSYAWMVVPVGTVWRV